MIDRLAEHTQNQVINDVISINDVRDYAMLGK